MVCNFTASLTKTGAGVEGVAYGTAAASIGWAGKTQNLDIKQTNETELNRTQDLSREVHSIDVLQKKFAGTHMFRVQDGAFLLAGFGTLNTTGVDPYTHTFITGDTLPSFTLYHEKKGRGVADLIENNLGCKVNEMKMSCSEGGYLEIENSIIAKDRATSSQEVFTSDSTTPFRFADISGSKCTVDASDLKLTSYEYTRSNNLSEEQEDSLIAEPCPQELTEGLNLGFKFKGTAARAPFIAGSEVPVVIVWTRGTHTLTVTHQVVFKEHPEPTGVEGDIEVSAVAEVRSTTIVLVDNTATYTF